MPAGQTAWTVQDWQVERVMRIEINGEPHEASEGTTLDALLVEIGVDPRGGAVERNREIVPRSAYGATVLCEGDRLEIVQFVGGG